ncbi:MAG: selenocysteine lyase/cysteine desulfurase [Candidatus Azotimanducaceae bacterium]|jgi:selenocysteine lyase/cysteine desulfurase
MPDLLQRIRENLIGERNAIKTTFGEKPLIYMDYTASGRSLKFVEDFIQDKVLPNYANTHSESSYTGKQMTLLRDQARQQVRESVNASEDHRVIFCGSGASAAIAKIIGVLGLSIPSSLEDKYNFSQQIPDRERTVVFLGPYEHHSNDLQWRESTAKVVRIGLDRNGEIDVEQLKEELYLHADYAKKIGTFSAASNVTGIKSDVSGITKLLQDRGSLAFWDYAAAAPYVGIDIKTSGADAIFLSPHKLVGGPGTPGILIADKKIFNNRVPVIPGGGTVDFVSKTKESYLTNVESREEAGTPGIVESIRAGLVFKLQSQVGTELIEEKESAFIKRAIETWRHNPSINILGDLEASRLAIVSFCITHEGENLHYGLVVAMLNDIFGIQARGGCSCAGPYGHELLGIDDAASQLLFADVESGNFLNRPGWTRLNFNYFIDEDTFEYAIRAVELIADHGHKLAPFYKYNQESGTFNYLGKSISPQTNLDDLFRNSDLSDDLVDAVQPTWSLTTLLAEGEEILRNSLQDKVSAESFAN